jgi:putative ABC transport system permease protein
MSIMETLRVAWEALVANKLRSALTMLGIIIGVGSVIAVIAIGRGTQAAVVGELEGFGRGVFELFPGSGVPGQALDRVELFEDRDVQMIKGLLPDVEDVSGFNQIGAEIRYENKVLTAAVSGANAATRRMFNLKIREGRWFSEAEETGAARVVVLGADSIKKLFGDENARAVGKRITINGLPFDVIGTLEKDTGMLTRLFSQEDANYYVPITFLQRATGRSQLMALIVKAKPGADTDTVMRDAIALMERAHRGAKYNGFSFAQVTSSVTAVTTILTGVVAAIAGISLVVGGVGIMNIMLVSVTERTREIGLRKAIGATYRDIMIQFLIEAVVICLFGGAIGVALASLPVWLVGRALQIPLLVDWTAIALALGFSVGVGVLFGVYPASKAARLDPIEALRYE